MSTGIKASTGEDRMKISRMGLLVVAAASLVAAQGASAQDWRWQRQQWQQQGPPPGQPPAAAPGRAQGARGGAACVPSGFGGLSRNCNVNTGGCQRMPGSCSLGWCCP